MDISIIFGIIGMICFGISTAILKKPAQKMDATRNLFIRNIFMSLLLFIVLLFFLKESIFNLKIILFTIIISIIGGFIPMITLYKALKHGKIGVVSPIAQSSMLFTIIFAVIFYGESLNTMQILSIIMVVIGAILMSINFKDFKKSDLLNLKSGILFALITCFLWGIGFFLLKIPINAIGPVMTSFLVEFSILITAAIILKLKKESLKMPDKNTIILYIFYALFAVIASLSINFGFKFANNISIVSAIVGANPIITTIYGKIIYKEKLKLQQYLALIIILLGVVGLSCLN